MRTELVVVGNDEDWRAMAASPDLVAALGGSPVFVRPEWLDAAWCWRDAATRRHFLLVRSGSAVGFAPLVLSAGGSRAWPGRSLRWLSVPDTQFADLACDSGAAAQIGGIIAAHLVAIRGRWDQLRLDYLADRFGHWRALPDALGAAGIRTVVEPAGSNPFVELAGTFESWYATRGRRLKKAVNLSANRLAAAGEVEIEWVREGPAVDAALAEAVRVSALSWKRGTGTSLDQPGPNAFISALTDAARHSGELSLWLLRLDGRVIATEYQVLADRNVYALRSDFDPAFAELSPGSYLNHQLIKRLFGQDLDRYYMGPGANAYKQRWTDTAEAMFHLTAYSPTTRGEMSYWLDRRIRPRLRRLLSPLRAAPPPSTAGKDGDA